MPAIVEIWYVQGTLQNVNKVTASLRYSQQKHNVKSVQHVSRAPCPYILQIQTDVYSLNHLSFTNNNLLLSLLIAFMHRKYQTEP